MRQRSLRSHLEREVPRAYAHYLTDGQADEQFMEGFFSLVHWLLSPPAEPKRGPLARLVAKVRRRPVADAVVLDPRRVT